VNSIKLKLADVNEKKVYREKPPSRNNYPSLSIRKRIEGIKITR
jgi:hypothetical protein